MTACAPTYSQYGAGATTDDRPVKKVDSWRTVWGAVGSKKTVDVANVCAAGDALLEHGRSFWNYTLVGLVRFKTWITVYCRDDAYRTARQAERRERQERFAMWQQQEAARLAAQGSPPPPPTAPVTQAPVVDLPVQSASQPAAPPPPPPSPPPPSTSSAPSIAPEVTIERKTISRALATVRTRAQCDAEIEATKIQDSPNATATEQYINRMNEKSMTEAVRKPCYTCVDGGKAFFIYARAPLQSSCD